MTITISPKRLAEWGLLLLIVLLAAWLRLTHVSETPGWYTDEATHIDIARHLTQGQVQYMAVAKSTLLFGRLPLFHIPLSILYRLFPGADGFGILRTFTGLLGVLSVLLLYVGLRRTGGAALALLAAGALAVYPQAVLYNRFGFSYNLLAPLLLIMLLCLDRFLEQPRAAWLIGAGLALGLCLISEVQALTYALVFGIIMLKRWRWLPLAIGAALLPVALYGLWMMVTASDAFLFDLRFTLSRLGTQAPIADQWAVLTHNLAEVIKRDVWVLPGLLGLFALPSRWRWMAVWAVLLPLVSMGRVVALYQLSAYYLIPLLPLLALGMVALIWVGAKALYAAAREHVPVYGAQISAGLFTIVMIAGLLALFVVPTVQPQFSEVDTGFVTEIDEFLVKPDDARAVAAFLNAEIQPDDVIITTPTLGWLLKGRPVDFQMAIALTDHIATPHLPADVDEARLAFAPNYLQARYVIIDHLWRQWGVVHVPGLDRFMSTVESRWERIFAVGDFVVYRAPRP